MTYLHHLNRRRLLWQAPLFTLLLLISALSQAAAYSSEEQARCYWVCVVGCAGEPNELPSICEDCCDDYPFVNVALKQ